MTTGGRTVNCLARSITQCPPEVEPPEVDLFYAETLYFLTESTVLRFFSQTFHFMSGLNEACIKPVIKFDPVVRRHFIPINFYF